MDSLKTLAIDPFVSTVVVGIVWPLVQAALDKPWWTHKRRIVLVSVAATVLSVSIWAVSEYPATVEYLATQLTALLGIFWAVYQILSHVKIGGESLIEWVGMVTPGGMPRGKHAEKAGE
ncbi:hypothetical protein HMPREF9241_01713 [Schaalia turicensis ACS-279-V-Col4]|uniref:Uncharacterized protein n=1 Tax=Schaalia turicensis ACS-279-V-Col4 TaxID=883077 RepID=K0YMQ8_9ACTO|nr:hypothetical protein [Schaalia turicensis]EJZ84937.1 hypothetical protein HMPREF9241_01713 [Schaalia turicensis ACS-279-V-Col4]